MSDIICGIAGFYSENSEPKSTALAVGAGSSVYIFKNMKPHFKFCIPHLEAHPKEREASTVNYCNNLIDFVENIFMN